MERAFFAHPKSWDDERIDGFVAALRTALPGVEVTTGRDDYASNIASEGHINAWIRSVTRRRDVDTGRRFYSLVVVPEERVGKATSAIVGEAIAASVPVVFAELDGDGTSVQQGTAVRAIEVVDAEDYFTGWRCVL